MHARAIAYKTCVTVERLHAYVSACTCLRLLNLDCHIHILRRELVTKIVAVAVNIKRDHHPEVQAPEGNYITTTTKTLWSFCTHLAENNFQIKSVLSRLQTARGSVFFGLASAKEGEYQVTIYA